MVSGVAATGLEKLHVVMNMLFMRQCLKGTLDEGIIMKPDRSEGLTCYVDADFAGNWTPEQALDPRACSSRTGFVIFHANCPIAWHSKLQTTISLSATEAKCVALSTAMRDCHEQIIHDGIHKFPQQIETPRCDFN